LDDRRFGCCLGSDRLTKADPGTACGNSDAGLGDRGFDLLDGFAPGIHADVETWVKWLREIIILLAMFLIAAFLGAALVFLMIVMDKAGQ